MTAHPNDREWDRLDALVDEDPIALRDAAWRLATALAAAEHRADEAEARIKAVRELHVKEPGVGTAYCIDCEQPLPCDTIRTLDGT